MSEIQLTKTKKEMAKILIKCAKSNDNVTFIELGDQLGIGRRQVAAQAMIISYKCNELDLPLLSVLIVNKSNRRTPNGFVEEFFEDEYNAGGSKQVIDRETKRVYEWKDWSRLETYLR